MLAVFVDDGVDDGALDGSATTGIAWIDELDDGTDSVEVGIVEGNATIVED